MKWIPYEKYKPSDVPGLEMVPAHWEVRKLKLLAEVRGGVAKGKDIAGQATVRVPYLRVANVQDGYLDLAEVEEIEIPKRELERYLLHPGDVLMNEGGDFDKLGRGHVWHGEVDPCIHQNHVFSVRPHGVRSEWLNTVTGSTYAQFFFMGRAKQSTNLASISASNISELPVVLPPDGEVGQLLAYLDRETAKIDALITEQRILIEVLREKRQSSIRIAVTKGLNPEAPMKPTGIDWLGDIPEHWPISRLGYYATVENGTTPSRMEPDYWSGGDIPWLASGEVNQGKITEASEFITSKALLECSLRLLPVGTVVIGMIGQGKTRGLSAILEIEAAINQNMAGIIPVAQLNSHYLQYLLSTAYDYLREYGRGGQQSALNCEILASFRIPIPPTSEQDQICESLIGNLRAFDDLTVEAQRAISLLQEHRSALITAVVTGKVDVREAVNA